MFAMIQDFPEKYKKNSNQTDPDPLAAVHTKFFLRDTVETFL